MVDFNPPNACKPLYLSFALLQYFVRITFSLIALMHINAISLIFVEKGQLGLFLCVYMSPVLV